MKLPFKGAVAGVVFTDCASWQWATSLVLTKLVRLWRSEWQASDAPARSKSCLSVQNCFSQEVRNQLNFISSITSVNSHLWVTIKNIKFKFLNRETRKLLWASAALEAYVCAVAVQTYPASPPPSHATWSPCLSVAPAAVTSIILL